MHEPNMILKKKLIYSINLHKNFKLDLELLGFLLFAPGGAAEWTV